MEFRADLTKTPLPGGWKPIQSRAWADFRFTSMHRLHRIISEYGGLADLDIRAASGQAIAFESRSGEKEEPSHRHAASRVAGASQEGAGRLSEGHSPDIPHRTIGAPPGSAGVPPACNPIACRSVSLRCGTRPPCRREGHGPGRSRILAPLSVEPGERDGRGCARTCAGGTPALPGGLSPLTSSH